MQASGSALLTDLDQLNMMAAYVDYDMTEQAVFELSVRKLSARRGFLMAAGLEPAVRFIETLRLGPEDIAKVRSLGAFSKGFIAYLNAFHFSGDGDAVPEGTVFFPARYPVEIAAGLRDLAARLDRASAVDGGA